MIPEDISFETTPEQNRSLDNLIDFIRKSPGLEFYWQDPTYDSRYDEEIMEDPEYWFDEVDEESDRFIKVLIRLVP